MGLLLRGRVAHERYADTDAAAAFRRALEIDPELEEARDRLAELLLELHQPAEATPPPRIPPSPPAGRPRAGRGSAQCLDLLGRQEEAARLLDGVLARQPDFGPALAARGKLALQAGQYAEAEVWLRRAERTRGTPPCCPRCRNACSSRGRPTRRRR